MKARNALHRGQPDLGLKQSKHESLPKKAAERKTVTAAPEDGFERLPRQQQGVDPKESEKNPGILGRLNSGSRRVLSTQAALLGAKATAIVAGSPEAVAPEVLSSDQFTMDTAGPAKAAQEFLNMSPRIEPKADSATDATGHVGLDTNLLTETPDGNQLEAWRKTTQSNGASAATIKAATDCYGKSGVFNKIVKNDQGDYTLTLQNKKEVRLSAAELKAASEASKFEEIGQGNDLDFANLSFAAMAKRAQSINGHTSYSAALRDLNTGEWPEKCASYLGIPSTQVEKLSSNALGKNSSVVAWGKSAVMVDYRKTDSEATSGKHVFDDSGKAKSFDPRTHSKALRFVSHEETAEKMARMNESLKDALKRHKGVSADLLAATEDGSQIKAWKQSNRGNCASIATIKAAVDCYGKPNVFNQITKNDNGSYDVRLQNGRTVHLTQNEINTVSRNSRFVEKGKGADIKFANFAFSVMAKENMRMSGFRSLTSSVSDLNDGESPTKCAGYLGIPKKQIESLTNKSKSGKDSIVAWNSAHAVMADKTGSGGRGSHSYDSYGTPKTYTGSRYPMAFRFIPPVPK